MIRLSAICWLWLGLNVGVQAATADSEGAWESVWDSVWDSVWHDQVVGKFCHLGLAARGYGDAKFVATPDQPIGFELQVARDFRAGSLLVWKHAPEWSSRQGPDTQLGKLCHIQGGGAVGANKLAGEMFLAMKEGYELIFTGKTGFSDPTELRLHLRGTDFFAAMENFNAYAQTSVLVSW